MPPFRILSLDGGGMRGIIPVQVLKEVERYTGKPIVEFFDLIAGTSTGGLLASALVVRKPHHSVGDKPVSKADLATEPLFDLKKIEKLYREDGPIIFPPCRNRAHDILRDIKNLFRPRFSAQGRNQVLEKHFGEARINQTLKPILITSYNVKNNRSDFFKTREAHPSSTNYKQNRNFLLSDICKATSAAPTYLPAHNLLNIDLELIHEIEQKLASENVQGAEREKLEKEYNHLREFESYHYIDGGVFMNNPTLGAIAEVLRNKNEMVYAEKSKHRDEVILTRRKNLKADDIYVLSIGTGNFDSPISKSESQRWGLMKWAAPVIKIMMNGVSQTVDYQARELLNPDNYLRINFKLTNRKYDDMADARKEALDYWAQEAYKQFINNPRENRKLYDFLDRS